jgi:hypothetical protein
MLSTVRLQTRADTFTQSVLATLRRAAQCLPPASLGLQLQRVRLRGASLRNSTVAVWRKWRDMGPHDQGLGYVDIKGKQVQFALAVTMDIAQTSTIAANPNKVMAAEWSADATVVFDVDCKESSPAGNVEIVYRIAVIEPAGTLPTASALTRQWIADQLNATLALQPFKLDLSGSIRKGASFANAGLAMDVAGTVVEIRAEVSAHPDLVNRWRSFHGGNIADHLGANAWSVFASGDQLKATLGDKVYDSLRDALGDNKDKLVSVDAGYEAQPGRVIFTLTPNFKVPVLGTEPVPVSVTLWIDTQAGNLIIDVDGYGIRDIASSILGIADSILRVFLPIVGALVSSFLHDAVGGLLNAASSLVVAQFPAGGIQIPGASATATLQALPGEPFRYRATLPLPTPPLTEAKIRDLIAEPDGFSMSGSWLVRNSTEGELKADCFGFGWQMPQVACGAPGEAVLHDIATNPMNHAWLLSRVKLSASGSSTVRLCSVAVVNFPPASAGVQLRWSTSNLPTTIDLVAPSSLLDLNLTAAIVLEVRTTIGVFRVRVAPPVPLTQEDLNMLRTGVRLQLKGCDTRIKPDWFRGHGHFEIDWIINPLDDPDRFDRQLDLVQVEVSGLRGGSKVVVRRSADAVLGTARATSNGTARMTFALEQGSPPPLAMVQPGVHGIAATARASGGGVAFFRQRLQRRGSVRLSSQALAVTSMPADSHFIVIQRDEFVAIDARHPSRAAVSGRWSSPGVRGVVPVRRGVFAFGNAGVFWFDSLQSGVKPDLLRRSVVADACASRDHVALLIDGDIEIWNAFAVRLSRIDGAADATAVMSIAGQLLVASAGELRVFDVSDPAAPCRLESVPGLGGSCLLQSALDGTIYIGRTDGSFIQIELGESGWGAVAEFSVIPWSLRAARLGRTVLHLGNGFDLNLLRIDAAPAMVSPQEGSDPEL